MDHGLIILFVGIRICLAGERRRETGYPWSFR